MTKHSAFARALRAGAAAIANAECFIIDRKSVV